MAKPRKKHPKEITTKTKKNKAAAQKKPSKGITRFNSPIDEGDKARFLQYLPRVISLRLAVASDTSDLRNAYKAAKAHGFSKADFDYAIAVQTPEREASTKENIRRRLLVAKWMGSDLGSQLDLFSEPPRMSTEERAYAQGANASAANMAAKPPYAPTDPAYAEYMRGFHDHQAAIVKAKIKKVADKYTTNHPTKLQGGLGMPKVPKPNGGGFGMDEEEFAAEQARAAPALTAHGLDEDEAP